MTTTEILPDDMNSRRFKIITTSNGLTEVLLRNAPDREFCENYLKMLAKTKKSK